MRALGRITRRTFLLGSVAIAGGAVCGFRRYRRPYPNPLLEYPLPDATTLTPYVLTDASGVTLVAPRAAMGQLVVEISASDAGGPLAGVRGSRRRERARSAQYRSADSVRCEFRIRGRQLQRDLPAARSSNRISTITACCARRQRLPSKTGCWHTARICALSANPARRRRRPRWLTRYSVRPASTCVRCPSRARSVPGGWLRRRCPTGFRPAGRVSAGSRPAGGHRAVACAGRS
jgi:hypothetical protein